VYRNIKGVGPTCLGTSVPSSGRSYYLQGSTVCSSSVVDVG